MSYTHDPGGKVRISLPPHVTGRAVFSEDGRYRQELWRVWGDESRFAMFIGTNPSTADELVDDPTCQREWMRAQRLEMGAYCKTNILDVRMTASGKLHRLDYPPCSDANLPAILRRAENAQIIVACWGILHGSLKHHADRTEAALRTAGHALHCLGRNQDGSPKHPLYVAGDKKLEPYTNT